MNAAQSACVKPSGFGLSFSPVAISEGLASPSSNRLRFLASNFASTSSSSAAGLRDTHKRNAYVRRSVSVFPPSRMVSFANPRAHSTNTVSFSAVSACSGVFVRVRFTQLASPTGTSNTVSAGYGVLRRRNVYSARR